MFCFLDRSKLLPKKNDNNYHLYSNFSVMSRQISFRVNQIQGWAKYFALNWEAKPEIFGWFTKLSFNLGAHYSIPDHQTSPIIRMAMVNAVMELVLCWAD